MERSAPQTEVWRNPGQGYVFVRKLDHRGDLTQHLQVPPGGRFNISIEERRLNMEMAASPQQDMFRNGSLVPIRLVEENEETKELASNPNAMSEDELKALVASHHKTFEAKLPSITNPSTLQRLLEHANAADASVRRVRMIEEHLDSVTKRDRLEPADRSQMRPVALR